MAQNGGIEVTMAPYGVVEVTDTRLSGIGNFFNRSSGRDN